MESTRVKKAASSDAGYAADLVSRIRAGDRQAEAELIERYGRGVMMILRQEIPKNAAVRDDLYQDTFRIAIEKIRQGDLREPAKLSAFICSVARNLVIEHFRRPKPESLTEIAESAPNQLEALLQQERATIVRHVIDELPTERDRLLLRRYYLLDHDKEQICADLGLKSLHFNRVLHRARVRFRELYEKASSKRKKAT
jgi:RNA polymerase sigma-70 factor (ECF subfamily)